MNKTDVLIIGAGMTGLCCAQNLKRDFLVLEKSKVPGGICQTHEVNGFLFDIAEHFIRVPNKSVLDFFKKILGRNFFSQPLVSSIYYDKRFIPYPFQKNLYYLSDRDKTYCLQSFIEKRDIPAVKKGLVSFGDWIMRNYGKGIADIFMLPYNRKIWQIDPYKMRSDFAFNPNIIPKLNLREMLTYALLSQEDRKEKSESVRFYPRKGGISELPKRLASRLKGKICYEKHVVRIDMKKKEVLVQDGSVYRYKTLISTLPLTEVSKLLKDFPVSLKKEIMSLKYNSLCIHNFALKKKLAFKEHWMYFPEPKIPFVRLYFLKNFNASMCPAGKGSLSVVWAQLPQYKAHFQLSEKKLVKILVKHRFLAEKDILFSHRQYIQYGMPIPTLDSVKIVNRMDRYLQARSIKTLGRYGLWKYQGIEHAIEDGQQINATLKGVKSG